MKAPREMSLSQFKKTLAENGLRKVLLWVEDTTGQVPGVSWGMLFYRSGKPAYRSTLAHVIRKRNEEIAKREKGAA